jgi:hypothetical protein
MSAWLFSTETVSGGLVGATHASSLSSSWPSWSLIGSGSSSSGSKRLGFFTLAYCGFAGFDLCFCEVLGEGLGIGAHGCSFHAAIFGADSIRRRLVSGAEGLALVYLSDSR